MNAPSQRGERTRDSILAVARRLFSDFGYYNTGIADIQAATGLTKGAFYHHFRGKLELALAVVEMAKREYEEQVFAPAMTRATVSEQLACVLDRLVQLNATPEWRNCRLLVALSATAGDGSLADEVRRLQEHIIRGIEGSLERAQQGGQAVAGPVGVCSGLVLGAWLGLVLMSKAGVPGLDPAGAVALLRRMVIGREGQVEPRVPVGSVGGAE